MVEFQYFVHTAFILNTVHCTVLQVLSVFLRNVILMLVCLSLQLEDGHTLFDYNVGLNEIVQLVIKTAIPSVDSNNNGMPAQEEAKKSGEKESNDSFEKANGHVSNGDQVIVFSIWNLMLVSGICLK